MRNPSVEREGKARAARGHSVDIPLHPNWETYPYGLTAFRRPQGGSSH